MLNVTTYTTDFFKNLIIFTLFKYWFSPHYYYLLITNYTYKGYLFPEKKCPYSTDRKDTRERKRRKKLPQKYCQTWCNKVRCHCPNKSSCLSVYATCKSSIPNLGTHQGFFFLFWSKRSSGQEILQFFFLEKKIQSLSNTVFSYIYLKLPHYFRIDTITVWGEACGGKRGRRGDSLFRNKRFVFDGIVQRNF